MRTTTFKTHIIAAVAAALLSSANISAAPSNQVPLTIDTWQQQRAEGLVNLPSITPNLLAVNAQDSFKIDHQKRHYGLHEIESVERLIKHPAVASIVVMSKDGDVMLEHYRDTDRSTIFSNQSSTKSMGYILLSRALNAKKVKLDDKVENYLPNIGKGFKGRTVADVANMAVNHNISELAAYTGDPEALEMFDNDERVIGLQRNDQRQTLRQFTSEIEAMGPSNQWSGKQANYATVNTNVLMLILEAATNTPADQLVRELMHEIGGEKTVYMGTDFEGVPMIGASMMSATLDFARYGRLLIEDVDAAKQDIKQASKNGEVVPAELTAIESRYYKSAIMNQYGVGHSGWGGQLIWADPESSTIIAINSRVASELPAPYDHFNKLYQASYDIIDLLRKQQ
ncbi:MULTISPECIES: serine hydrolase domain-containing protein [unclassified Agarivorans]|uniref:serine hydrolase domain-containing protein n=1 Tax=unclassified Agarivorans TaxID=2636026 RepID=UPI0026E21116|nr:MULTISPECIES: serine hydrolase [unclassified Agarivorans]MDO6683854.1 serine hydrolase [Agarivorans sp. 3_MG-2023]MDO6714413.1 serine hydrolase [Agarivorans sp. 2_MG-2023]